MIFQGMDLEKAVAAGRVHWEDNRFFFEGDIDEAIRARAKKELDHPVTERRKQDLFFGGVHAVEIAGGRHDRRRRRSAPRRRGDPAVSYKFSGEIRVRLSETDGLGVVYHGTLLHLLRRREDGVPAGPGLLEPFKTGESLNLIVHASADFRSPARFDDVLLVHVRTAKLGDSSVTFEFRVELKADGRLIAEGRSVRSCIDSKTWKPPRVPEAFRSAIRSFEGSDLDEKP